MRHFTEAIKKGLDMYRHRDQFAYFYGAKGQILTDSVMNALWAAEPAYFAKYNAEQKAQIFRNSRGKRGFDCSGFTGELTGDRTWSTGQISNCRIITTPRDGVGGSLLYTTFNGTGRHIGYDIGYGYCVDMGYESTDQRVSEHNDSVRLTRIVETPWEKSGQSNVLDYTGATNL